ncbi:acetylxylan esterase [Streptomyces sp. NBC_01006]|uniref:acetylxylan esterase n=1 Tax=Streptomyces sp. NBC_01006 TaxID=2903716 RepID=UPI003868CAF9|nr:acetylxylan esterase [Streptomyces sp. NBC_01006]
MTAGPALGSAIHGPGMVNATIELVRRQVGFRHAAATCADGPYQEIAKYLRRHSRHRVEPAFATLDHFDGVHFARRATAPTVFSVGLMDPVCPPSTVYAAFNHYAGEDRTMTVWPFGDHGGGCGSNPPVQLAWLRDRGLAPEL